ncbi:MarR family transcriptional regulator [Sphingosinicellaceae bacterium]|nr:MarR family transcriptional regulator [Sphingosinicellaceae bacterium]
MASAMREKHDGALGRSSNVRLWLRLLSCTMVIEKQVRRGFSARFDTTLPRFDVLAALDRHPDGMTLGALSSSLLVSNGNVTALIQKLVADGHVSLEPSPADRRASVARLTRAGQTYFDELAEAHHGWIDAMLAGISPDQRDLMFDLLGAMKVSIAHANVEEMP